MKLKTWEIALICAFLTVFMCGFSVQREEAALSGKLVRLHVVANSDSEADQALKLRVRDAVLEYLRPRLEGVEDAEEARRILDGSLEGIVEAAGAVTDGEGAGYGVTASLCRESFPTTQYDNFALPAGECSRPSATPASSTRTPPTPSAFPGRRRSSSPPTARAMW